MIREAVTVPVRIEAATRKISAQWVRISAYLMRMAGRFSRRIRGYAKARGIPVIDCSAGQRKHDLSEEYLAKTTVTQGLFLVLVGRAQAPVWDVNAKHHIERKKPMPYVNHYSFVPHPRPRLGPSDHQDQRASPPR
jgi:hypothetical protein